MQTPPPPALHTDALLCTVRNSDTLTGGQALGFRHIIFILLTPGRGRLPLSTEQTGRLRVKAMKPSVQGYAAGQFGVTGLAQADLTVRLTLFSTELTRVQERKKHTHTHTHTYPHLLKMSFQTKFQSTSYKTTDKLIPPKEVYMQSNLEELLQMKSEQHLQPHHVP